MKKNLPIFIIAIVGLLATNFASAQDSDAKWGTLTGQVIVEGTAPTNPPEDIKDNADKAVCLVDGAVPLDNNILVGEKGELKDVIVMMYLDRGDDEPAYHPSFEEKKSAAVTIDNIKCRFEPHVAIVRPGQPITLKNSDSVGHNCNITTLNNAENVNLPANSSVELVLKESDKVPGEVKCNMHGWMDSVIFVRDNPYVAVTDAEGKFRIENVPAGDWKFQLWHKKVGYLSDLQVPDKKLGRRGDFEVTIPADETLNLGELKLPATSFK